MSIGAPKSIKPLQPLDIVTIVRDEILQLGLDAVLKSIFIVGTVRHCRNQSEARGFLDVEPPDVLILSELDEELVGALAIGGEHTKVLLLLQDADIKGPNIPGSLSADGFLVLGELSATVLEDTLHQLVAGQVPMPAPLARKLIQRASGPSVSARPRNGALTARENEALALLAEGLSNKQIARRLAISSHGVKRIVASVLLKLGAPNRTAAVVEAIRSGLIECLRGKTTG